MKAAHQHARPQAGTHAGERTNAQENMNGACQAGTRRQNEEEEEAGHHDLQAASQIGHHDLQAASRFVEGVDAAVSGTKGRESWPS